MRAPLLRVLLPTLLLTACFLPACGDTRPKQQPADERGEWVQPFDGYLLGRDVERTTVLQVVDVRTGAPIEGAVVRQAYEMDVGDGGWGPTAQETRTDRFGMAWILIPWADGTLSDSHWTVHAPGYATAHEYGTQLDERIELEPERPCHGRIVDPLGRPLAGIDVGYKEGCGHAPWITTARTDADGRFVLTSTDAEQQVYYVAPGCLATYFGGPLRSLDQTPWTQVAEPAVTLRGRIVGTDGLDLGRRLIYCTADQRGVFAPLADDNSFVLHGVVLDGYVSLYDSPPWVKHEIQPDDWHPRYPMVWDLSLGRRNPTESDTIAERTLRVRLETDDGDAPVYTEVAAVRTIDGRIQDDNSYGDEDDLGKPLELKVLPGSYELVAGGPTEAYIGGPLRVDVGRDDPAPITLTLRANPRVDVMVRGYEGEAHPQVAVAGASGHADHESMAHDEGHAPAGATARVSLHDGMTARFFDVGPVKGGVRPALVDWPKDREIRFTSDVAPGTVYLGNVEHEAEQHEHGWTIKTSADGTFVLRIGESDDYEGPAVEDFVRRVELTGPRDIPLDLGRLAWTPTVDRTFTLLGADGAPLEDVKVTVHTFTYPGASWRVADDDRHETDEHGAIQSDLLEDGAWVIYEIEERPFRYLCNGDGPYVARVGDCTLEVEVHGRWGILLEAEVMLDGRMEAPVYVDEDAPDAARYLLTGLQPGAHTLVVAAEGHRGEARRVVLTKGETRRIRVELPERK